MRILESAPSRYDLGIRILTLGRLDRAYDRLTSRIGRGQRVLDLGCGTGALTLRAARRGALVKGIDINPAMLAIAGRRLADAGVNGNVRLAEMGVAELDGEEPDHYDAVMSGLCFSELSDDEASYALKQAFRVLRTGGLFLLADELKAPNAFLRTMQELIRAPLAALAYLVTQQTSRPTSDPVADLRTAGFAVLSVRKNLSASFGEYVAQKPAAGPP